MSQNSLQNDLIVLYEKTREKGQGQGDAHDDRDEDAHEEGCLFSGPHDEGTHLACGCADGGSDEHREADKKLRRSAAGEILWKLLSS